MSLPSASKLVSSAPVDVSRATAMLVPTEVVPTTTIEPLGWIASAFALSVPPKSMV